MNPEINYKIQVEPALFTILAKIAGDVGQFGITPDEFTRALWAFTSDRLDEYDTEPQWVRQELEYKRQRAEASNTIDGEVGMGD